MEMTVKVFVYGTLQCGQRYHHLIADKVRSVQPAAIRGTLYHLPFEYPALFAGAGEVRGELLELADGETSLAILDELENYHGAGQDNEYERLTLTATTSDGRSEACFVYLYSDSRRSWVEEYGILVENGDWADWMRERSAEFNEAGR